MEPQYYPRDEWVRSQLDKTQDAQWATRVLVYGAINKLPGWPTLWDLLFMAEGDREKAVRVRLRLFAARLISRTAGFAVARLPGSTQQKLLDKMKLVSQLVRD